MNKECEDCKDRESRLKAKSSCGICAEVWCECVECECNYCVTNLCECNDPLVRAVLDLRPEVLSLHNDLHEYKLLMARRIDTLNSTMEKVLEKYVERQSK